MKTYYKYILLLLSCLFVYSCNDEWKDEQYVKKVSFAYSGVVNVRVKYGAQGGVIPIKVPVLVSGSTKNDKNVEATIGIDKDTLTNLNFERFRNREDLWFKELPASNYDFESMSTTIPKGSDVGYYNLNLKIMGVDWIDKYILPIKLVSTSGYEIANRKHFKKSLLRIVPFNNYSGTYAVAGKVTNIELPNEEALSVPSREAFVVDENSVFFFAGITDEQLVERRQYKIKAEFKINGQDSTVVLTSDEPGLELKVNEPNKQRFRVTSEMDPVLPYKKKILTTVNLEYEYVDKRNKVPFKYKFSGAMTMERVRNILIPEQDDDGAIIIP